MLIRLKNFIPIQRKNEFKTQIQWQNSYKIDSTLYASTCRNVHIAITTTPAAAARSGSQGTGKNYRNPSKIKVALQGHPLKDCLFNSTAIKTKTETEMAPVLRGLESEKM